MDLYDVIIVGGGPAGLSAALMLGRCRRRVLVFDSGQYRNAHSHGVHGFLSRDCILPSELLDISRRQLEPYGVERCEKTVERIEGSVPAFEVVAGELRCKGRRVLIATGVTDTLPDIPNVRDFYGVSVHHCPYCDGWEHRDQPIAVYGAGKHGWGLALSLKTWSADVVLCTNGPAKLDSKQREDLKQQNIAIYTESIQQLEGENGDLQRIRFRDGSAIERRAIFFSTGQRQTCTLGPDLKCALTHRGAIKTDKFERTSVPGIFAAGDCSRNVQWVSVAVAQGAIAAEAINIELQKEDRAAQE